MLSISRKINKNYAWEIIGFHKVRYFKDGIDFFELICDIDFYKGDHNPQFRFFLEILNFTILEIEVYNVNHIDENEGDFPIAL
jgi:hypothetical protein